MELITMNELRVSHILRQAAALGWDGDTRASVLADTVNGQIVLVRHQPTCCLCGEGDFTVLLHIGRYDKRVCENCVPLIMEQLRIRYDVKGNAALAKIATGKWKGKRGERVK